jgi:hypothetical protein
MYHLHCVAMLLYQCWIGMTSGPGGSELIVVGDDVVAPFPTYMSEALLGANATAPIERVGHASLSGIQFTPVSRVSQTPLFPIPASQ